MDGTGKVGKKDSAMTEKKRFVRFVFVAGLVAGLFASTAQAELGMQNIVDQDGLPALGSAVRNAVDEAYQSSEDPAVIEATLVKILNEAAASENESIIRYAITGVMLGGGVEHLDMSKSAIDNSDVFKNYPELTAIVVATCEKLLPGFEEIKKEADGTGGESGEETGDTAPEGNIDAPDVGDESNPFEGGNTADIEDGDVEATDT